ncbi:hypothetical protein F2Q69_00037162 [Brassica cretica]|uniref:Uncharacterized protein n=1 Tax=Brassica cretica TaxID=69181 RepID=A0A8S9SQB1_BRACR|nr:hypothetical protein F2Q69_00037162 [Brassica cretica]
MPLSASSTSTSLHTPLEAINPNVIRENEFLLFLNPKVPTVTPIEMKQGQVRSSVGKMHEGLPSPEHSLQLPELAFKLSLPGSP